MTETIRKTFEQQLTDLQDDILSLGDMVENALIDSVEMLKQRDFEGSRALIEADRALDEKRYEIEAQSLLLIATQQPMAGDLRLLAAVLLIANELERIGDYAKGIARANLRIGEQPLMKPLIDIPRMAEIGRDMLHRGLQAFVGRDVSLARAVIDDDELVDALYDQVYAELITKLMESSSQIRQANLLLMVAHNLERTADRVTNICERAIYCVTGEFLDTGWEDDVA